MPAAVQFPPGLLRQSREAAVTVFVRILCMDTFAISQRNVDAADTHMLVAQTFEMHFHAMFWLVEERDMPERVEIEVGSGDPVEVAQDIQIELSGDATLIIVGVVENARILDQVDANQQVSVGAGKFP